MADFQKLIVFCVYWEGDFRKRQYKPHWVKKLRNMVKRNLPAPHRFVCLTNVPEKCDFVETITLTTDFPGWWAKLELFRPDILASGERMLYLDLDTVITGDLTPIAEFDAPIAFMPPSHTFAPTSHKSFGKGIVDRYQSSCFIRDDYCGTAVWKDFYDDAMKEFRGDQDWIGHALPGVATFPPAWFSKLRGFELEPKPGAIVHLCMPLKNEIQAKRIGWVGNLWK